MLRTVSYCVLSCPVASRRIAACAPSRTRSTSASPASRHRCPVRPRAGLITTALLHVVLAAALVCAVALPSVPLHCAAATSCWCRGLHCRGRGRRGARDVPQLDVQNGVHSGAPAAHLRRDGAAGVLPVRGCLLLFSCRASRSADGSFRVRMRACVWVLAGSSTTPTSRPSSCASLTPSAASATPSLQRTRASTSRAWQPRCVLQIPPWPAEPLPRAIV